MLPRRFLPLLLLFYLAVTLVGIDWYPPVWVDEGWIAEPAWALASGGPLGSPSCGEVFRFADRLYWMPPLHFLALAALYVLGAPVLWGGRLLSLVLGGATLLILMRWAEAVLHEAETRGARPVRVARGVGLRWLLIGIGIAFIADPMLWKAHRTIRFESMLGLWSVTAVAAAWNPTRRWRGPLVGAAAALAALTHPNALLTAVAAGGVLLLRRRSWSQAWRDVLLAVAVGLALCLPFAIYLLQDHAAGFANILGQNAPHLEGERGASLLVQWQREITRYRSYFAWPVLALPLLAWAATLAAAIRLRAPAALGWVVAVHVIGLACLPNKSELYLTLVAPFVFVAAAWVALRVRARWAAAAGGLWLASLVAADAGLLLRDHACDYDAWTRPLAGAAPAGAGVAGSFQTWIPFREHRFYSVSRVRAGDLLQARPDLLVWTRDMDEGPQFARLRRELGPFLREHADTLLRIDSPCYGSAVLLRPHWGEATEAAATWERHGFDRHR